MVSIFLRVFDFLSLIGLVYFLYFLGMNCIFHLCILF